jgi:hypothetical protein
MRTKSNHFLIPPKTLKSLFFIILLFNFISLYFIIDLYSYDEIFGYIGKGAFKFSGTRKFVIVFFLTSLANLFFILVMLMAVLMHR